MIIDHIRDLKEFWKFYNERPMDDGQYTFEHIVNNPNLFCFYDEVSGILKAFIFITQDDKDRLFLSGAGARKNMLDNINAIIKICEAFPCEMYSNTDKKEAKLILRKAGFKQIEQDLFVRLKNG